MSWIVVNLKDVFLIIEHNFDIKVGHIIRENTFMMCPTFFLSIYMILVKIILDMFSARTRYIATCGKYIATNVAIRYKKDGLL